MKLMKPSATDTNALPGFYGNPKPPTALTPGRTHTTCSVIQANS
jgi:hypothetical protein